jgi:hypothetical protein
MPDVQCRLLPVDNRTGFTCLLKVPPNDMAPVHRHVGALETYMLSGDMCCDTDDVGVEASHLFEPAEDIHQPQSKGGTVLSCIFHGPIAGLNDDASVAGMCDNWSMPAWARDHGVAHHAVIA